MQKTSIQAEADYIVTQTNFVIKKINELSQFYDNEKGRRAGEFVMKQLIQRINVFLDKLDNDVCVMSQHTLIILRGEVSTMLLDMYSPTGKVLN